MKTERNYNYDFIRLVGLLIIMLAHSSPPVWLFQLRNFGTPLLVVGSALTYSLIYSRRKLDLVRFYRKRLSRLVFPAWIFLSLFFLFWLCISDLQGAEYPFSLYRIVGSYTFMGGIGFVWVLKVYIILALLTPFAVFFNRYVKQGDIYFLLLLLAYIFYELAVYVASPFFDGFAGKLLKNTVFQVFPYAIIYFYGFRLGSLSVGQILLAALFSFSVFVGLLIFKFVGEGVFVPTQDFKYPPTIYYLSYAFFAVNVTVLLCKKINFTNEKFKAAVVWLSSNSLWIYLWHIMAYYIWESLFSDPSGDLTLFVYKTSFLLGVGVLLTVIQNYLVSLLRRTEVPYKDHVLPLLSGSK